MAGMPRLLPLVAVAIGGVIAVNAVRGAPQLIGFAKAFAEDAAPSKGGKAAISPTAAVGGDPTQAKPPPAPACAPSAAELAKEAGLSPAELQVLQSLGARRGQLDQREEGLDTQVQLIAAAEAKLDARIQEMNGLKADIQGLVGQADAQQQAETARLINVYEKMKPKDAAGRDHPDGRQCPAADDGEDEAGHPGGDPGGHAGGRRQEPDRKARPPGRQRQVRAGRQDGAEPAGHAAADGHRRCGHDAGGVRRAAGRGLAQACSRQGQGARLGQEARRRGGGRHRGFRRYEQEALR